MTSPIGLPQITKVLATGFGLLGIVGGLTGVIAPQQFVPSLGIPLPVTNPRSSLPYVAFVGMRNLGTGIGILSLLYAGQKRAAGIVLCSGVVVAMGDAWICLQSEAERAKTIGHAVAGLLMGAVGYTILQVEQ